MSEPYVDLEYAYALRARCGLSGCDRPPGEPCINSVTGEGPRDRPHWNRVARGRWAWAEGTS